MDITVYLAQIWGVMIFAIGLGVIINRDHYIQLYRDLKKEGMAVLVFAMLAIILGMIHVGAHNVWGSLSEVIVSLFGWGLLIKGIMLAVYPKFADKAGSWVSRTEVMNYAGGAMLVIGAYLSWVGFLM